MNEDQAIPPEQTADEISSPEQLTQQPVSENVNDPLQQQPSAETRQQPDSVQFKMATKEFPGQAPQPVMANDNHYARHHKKWKDYLFDFLMLFLAVTAGFFMENKREYYLEHQREKQYVELLLADLRLDSIVFEQKNEHIQTVEKGNDTLVHLLTGKKNATDKEIMEILLPATFAFDIPATTTTYNQMKASGSLRYIENLHLTAQLQTYYDVLLPRCIEFTQTSLTYFAQTINPFYLKHLRIQDYDPYEDTLINKHPVIMNRTPQTDQELANIMGGYRALLKIQAISMNKPAFQKIKELIVLLKKEYAMQ